MVDGASQKILPEKNPKNTEQRWQNPIVSVVVMVQWIIWGIASSMPLKIIFSLPLPGNLPSCFLPHRPPSVSPHTALVTGQIHCLPTYKN